MFIIDVVPIAKNMGKEYLSYFISKDISPGTLVSIPVRKKTVFGIVIKSTPAEKRKTDIKSSTYSIRKAKEISPNPFLDKSLISAAEKTARSFATTTGKVLQVVIPNAILEEAASFSDQESIIDKKDGSDSSHEKFLLQTQPEDRFAHYKSLVREDFAKQKSVFFCLPTIEKIKKAKENLEKGIEQYTYILHGSLTKKEIRKIWKDVTEEKHPVLIIATPIFISLPRKDLGSIILEQENSSSYKLPHSPFLDMRVYAENVSRQRGLRFILGDTLLRVETLWRYRNMEFTEYMPIKYRSLTQAESELIDMRHKKKESSDEENEKKVFSVFSDELKNLLVRTADSNEKMILFASRRGLSPITVCGDCGSSVTCNECSNPVVLHENKKKEDRNHFLCHKCGVSRSAHETCQACGSWRLQSLGIGTERIAQEITELYPESPVFIVDKDHTRTHKQVVDRIKQFYQTPGGILVGTEMALLHLSEPVENIAVVSLDSLFSVPDFRINEKVMNILSDLRLTAQKKFIIQTRDAEQPVLQHGLAGNLIEFYREEIDARKKFNYPPFSVLIKITRKGKRGAVRKDMEWLARQIGQDNISVYPGTPPVVKGNYIVNALLKIPRDKWIDEDLLVFLRSLPPQFRVSVDPDSVL